MAANNLPITILILGGGVAMAWVGITDPQGGLIGQVGRVLRGEPSTTKPGGGAAAAAAAVLGASDAGAGLAAGEGIAEGAVGASAAGSSNPVVKAAASQLGVPYVWGGGGASGPSAGGFDCSGLTQYAEHAAYGITIPRLAATQQINATRVPASQAAPGDLVFFGSPAYHCGVYVGGGQMIHAPHTGTVVKYEPVSDVTPGPVTYGRYTPVKAVAT